MTGFPGFQPHLHGGVEEEVCTAIHTTASVCRDTGIPPIPPVVSTWALQHMHDKPAPAPFFFAFISCGVGVVAVP